ncbi:hypothetical protein [Paenibacillus glucanolyticus]|uniref:hypothetical protein n=1 Tax=Paenibacillus glucanolyticus TaxID=59843 RepID=UPI00128D8262|nr:hypothetical protein [Paenibacillus glucanolyticus]MPY20259.1 hypothetical protein [Paenibacillus glucanolyticus]
MINKIGVKHLIGRELTNQETSVLEWLNGWEEETSSIIAGLIHAAYQHGKQESISIDSKKMTEEEIQQFALALAERYLQVEKDHAIASELYKRTCSEEYSQAIERVNKFVAMEQAFAVYKIFAEAVDVLPEDIKHAFSQHYERLIQK